MKSKILKFLDYNKIKYKIIKHNKVNTCKEQAVAAKIKVKQIAKSLIFKVSKNKFILAIGPGNKSFSTKGLSKHLNFELVLAKPNEVKKIANCDPGAVYPLGNLMKLKTYLDADFLKNNKIYFSPGSHNDTIEISKQDFLKIVNPEIINFRIKKESKQESTLGMTAKKLDNFSEWYTQVIQKSEMADYTSVSGCIVFRPYSYSIWEKMQSYFDKMIKKSGVQNAYFPVLIPENLLTKEAKHVEGFAPEVAWVTHGGNSKLNERLAVRPTSETIAYDSYAKWIRSYNDLPLRLNFWNNVVRWEFKHATPFLRTREFLWHEGHTAFATQKEAGDEVLEILEYYREVHEDLLAIPVIKGTKTDTEKFAGADYSKSCESFLPVNKAIQVCTSHHLGQNFSKAFDISFVDKDGKNKYVWQNSWAFTTRSIGIMIIMHGDDKGLVLPPRIAPIQIVIIPILFDKTKKQVLNKANELKKQLEKYSVKLDIREEYTPGWKYNEWELKGVPLRIEVGPKDIEKNQVVIVRRDTGKKEVILWTKLNTRVEELLDEIQTNLFNRAKKRMMDSLIRVKSWDEFLKAAKDKKWIKAMHCAEAKCEKEIKDKTQGIKTNNIPFDQPKKLGKCVHCNKKAKYEALFAKSY